MMSVPSSFIYWKGLITMSEYQLEIKQIVDYPRCRIYRQFIQMLLAEKNIRVGGTSGLFYYTVLCCYANFRTSYKRIDGISYTIRPGEWLCRISEVSEWFRTRFHIRTPTFPLWEPAAQVKPLPYSLWLCVCEGKAHRYLSLLH